MKTDLADGILAPIALIIILAATAVPFFFYDNDAVMAAFPYVFGAGALMLLIVRLLSPFRGDDLRLRRWYRIQSWSAIFFCAATAFLFIPGATRRDWLAFTLAGAAVQAIASVVISIKASKDRG